MDVDAVEIGANGFSSSLSNTQRTAQVCISMFTTLRS